ncbi:MAG: T9SS type A sorting domain-containing protein [Bacteroidota bacterium]
MKRIIISIILLWSTYWLFAQTDKSEPCGLQQDHVYYQVSEICSDYDTNLAQFVLYYRTLDQYEWVNGSYLRVAEIEEDYNPVTQAWETIFERFFTYDEQDRLQQEIEIYFFSDSRDTFGRSTWTYQEIDEGQIITRVYEGRSNGRFVNSFQQADTLFEDGRIQDEGSLEWSAGLQDWFPVYHASYKYDADNKLIEKKDFSRNFATEPWKPRNIETYLREENGEISLFEQDVWSETALDYEPFLYREYTYDNQGRLSETVEYWNLITGWQKYIRVLHDYDECDRLIYCDILNWDPNLGDWTFRGENFVSFNELGQVAEAIDFYYPQGSTSREPIFGSSCTYSYQTAPALPTGIAPFTMREEWRQPNPISHQHELSFDFEGGHSYDIFLVDMQGRTIVLAKTSHAVRIPLQDIQAGIYILQVQEDHQPAFSQKLIIQH